MSSTIHEEFRLQKRSQYLRWLVLVLLMIFCLVLVSPALPTPYAPLARARSLAIKVMPLGDSITYGWGSSTGGGYRLPLWNELKARGATVDFVGSQQNGPPGFDRDHEGHPGWKINQITENVVAWLLTYQPQIVLLHIGTNDFIKNDRPAQAPARLSHLIDLITATLPGVQVIVAQIIPLPRSARLNAEVEAYNAAIPGIVRSKIATGKHVRYIDMYHAVPPGLLPDQIHPNDAAYALMARAWLPALLPLLGKG